jgi:hypothetical protein
MSAFPTESCSENGRLLALVVRASFQPGKTTFVTPDSCNQQLGFIVYAAGTSIPRHAHLPLERTIHGTNEVVIVRRGRCTAEIYGERREVVARFELRAGDIILLNGGAHGFQVHEDTVLVEVKQGPYTIQIEKERF